MGSGKKYKGLYILAREYQNLIYPDCVKNQIEKDIHILTAPFSKDEVYEHIEELNECDIVFAGWGSVTFDKEILPLMPNLKAVFYGAGSIKSIVTEEFWSRDIMISSAYGANAVPVAEYALSQIIFGLKGGYRLSRYYTNKEYRHIGEYRDVIGCYNTTVGIISLGMIGRLLCEHLKNFDMNVIAYDPFVPDDVFVGLNASRASTLDEIFVKSDAVSLHTPWLPSTENMIRMEHFDMMKENALFVNTSRGAIVNEQEMIEALKRRPDLFAILDVTYPEPPRKNSPLYAMANVVLTPHIAGAMNGECARMGQYMADEFKKWIEGEPLKYAIDEKKSHLLA